MLIISHLLFACLSGKNSSTVTTVRKVSDLEFFGYKGHIVPPSEAAQVSLGEHRLYVQGCVLQGRSLVVLVCTQLLQQGCGV